MRILQNIIPVFTKFIHNRERAFIEYMFLNKLSKITGFIKTNIVLFIATVLAVISAIIVPPDSHYTEYFDLKTLTCLFCTLAVICALKNIKFFTIMARKIVKCAGNTRTAVIALVYITFIGSMIIANDMALLTFLPLGYFVLSSTGKHKYMAVTFILQNIAANLGGMLTPFGNPQNLYLYTKFNIKNVEFIKIMLLPFIISISIITVCCLFIHKETLTIENEDEAKLPKGRTMLYIVLFLTTILTVFRVIPYYICLVAVVALLLVTDRKALKKVDYSLLFTFVAFFILAGNISRIGAVNDCFSFLLGKNTLLTSVISCQFISNVPSAILLSQFTSNYSELLVGVNIGGVGTLIASLASLITFREYTSHYKNKTLSYIGLFSAFNFGFLILLTVIMLIIM